ncbi:MAG: TIGR00730 family Rossman fold protein [Bacteriovoracaceae bacterium]|nr:TIGR00730 family Rossman fold protein [Bacteriovoracaceae bacterium]
MNKKIAIFCGARSGRESHYVQMAKDVANILAQNNIDLVFGGGKVGLMGVLADSILSLGGNAYGVIPKLLVDKEVAHTELTELFIVPSMHERKKKIYDLADSFLVLPGGLGTLDEMFEILTWAQLGLHQKKCGLYNYNGFYNGLITHLDFFAKEGFDSNTSPAQQKLFFWDSNLPLLMNKILS